MGAVSHPEADDELRAAALWYEDKQPGLGDAFLRQFENTLSRVVAHPERWRKSEAITASSISSASLTPSSIAAEVKRYLLLP
jgi:hypothetical protein